jgi:hydrogenase 3 maturation protease
LIAVLSAASALIAVASIALSYRMKNGNWRAWIASYSQLITETQMISITYPRKRYRAPLAKQPALEGNPDLCRLAIVGIGHEFGSDDSVGLAVVRRLQQVWDGQQIPADVTIIEAGSAPENCLGKIIRHKPEIVIFVDAAQMGKEPGTLEWVHGHEAVTGGGSSHTLSLATLAQFITNETDADILIAAIQVANTSFGDRLSPQIEKSIEPIVQALVAYCRKAATAASAKTAGGVSVVNTL